MSDTLQARIPPYNPSLGHVVGKKTIVTDIQSKTFKAGLWYTVTPEVAKLLKTYYQRDNDPASGKLFTICTLEQAKAIIDREQRGELAQRGHAAIEKAPEKAPSLDVAPSDELNAPAPVHQIQVEAEARRIQERAEAKAAAEEMAKPEAVDSPTEWMDGLPGVPAEPAKAPEKKAPKRKAPKRKSTRKKAAKKPASKKGE